MPRTRVGGRWRHWITHVTEPNDAMKPSPIVFNSAMECAFIVSLYSFRRLFEPGDMRLDDSSRCKAQ